MIPTTIRKSYVDTSLGQLHLSHRVQQRHQLRVFLRSTCLPSEHTLRLPYIMGGPCGPGCGPPPPIPGPPSPPKPPSIASNCCNLARPSGV